jgi:hypothetical protein
MIKKSIFLTVCVILFVAPVAAEPNCVTEGGYLASASEELFDIAMLFLVRKDQMALRGLIDSGSVIVLKSGIPVDLESAKILGGKTKIRPVGSTISVWTNIAAVDCKELSD